nr:Asp_protease_2 domain-containing protein [Tanacetum cinerariifolium]
IVIFTTHENLTQKILKSVFVTNFLEDSIACGLWKVCSDYGTVVDVFIPFKGSKSERFLNHPGVGSRFTELIQATNSFENDEMIVGISIEGLPIKAWTPNTFLKIAYLWDDLSSDGESQEGDVANKVDNNESGVDRVSESSFRHENDTAHKDVNVCKKGEVGSHSEDPFNIYEFEDHYNARPTDVAMSTPQKLDARLFQDATYCERIKSLRYKVRREVLNIVEALDIENSRASSFKMRGIHVLETKVNAVRDWSSSKTLPDVRNNKVANVFQEEDELEYAEPLDGEAKQVTYVVQRTLCSPKVSDSSQRNKQFQTKCLVKEKSCYMIIDGGSCENLVSKALVNAFNLLTKPHPSPYQYGRIKKGLVLMVTKICKVPLVMGKHYNELVSDVIDMGTCHVLLGRPWQHDVDYTWPSTYGYCKIVIFYRLFKLADFTRVKSFCDEERFEQHELTGNVQQLPYDSPLPSVHTHGSDEGRMKHNELMDLVTKLSDRVVALETDLKQNKKVYGAAYTKLIMKWRYDQDIEFNLDFDAAKEEYTNEKEVSTAELVSTVGAAVTTASVEVSHASPTRRISTVDDITIAETLVYIRSATKDNGKGIMTESEPENIRARVKADEELTQRLQVEERNKYSKVDQVKMLVDLIKQRKRYFFAQKSNAKKNKPMTQAQQRTYMSNYIKHMGRHTLQQLRGYSFDELNTLFETTTRRVNTFVLIESEVDRAVPEFAVGSSKGGAEEELDQGSSKRKKTSESSELAEAPRDKVAMNCHKKSYNK